MLLEKSGVVMEGAPQADEYDAEGRRLCGAVLWGGKCRWIRTPLGCHHSHDVPEDVAAKYRHLLAADRLVQAEARAAARAARAVVVPPAPQPPSVELARTVGRCKLDHGLKAPGFLKVSTNEEKLAFTLNLVFELAPLQHGAHLPTRHGRAVQVDIRLTPC